MEFEYFVFDKDGTLIDDIGTYESIFCKLARSHFDISEDLSSKFYLETLGMPLEMQVRELVGKVGREVEFSEVMKFKEEFHEMEGNDSPVLFEGIGEILDTIKKKGKKIFLSTGDDDEVAINQLRESGLEGYFDKILGSSGISKGESHFREFARFVGEDFRDFTKKCCLIGDGLTDVEIAKESGVYIFSVSTTFSRQVLKNKGSDKILGSLRELLNFI